MGLSFTIAAGLASAVILRSEDGGTHDHILLSQIRDSPNLEGQVPVFIPPRNRVAQLYPQALCSFFVFTYDSQGYGGGITTSLHTVTKWYIKIQFVPQRKHHISVPKPNRLMLLGKKSLFTVRTIRNTQINSWGTSQNFIMLEQMAYIVTTGL
jgi:hypothetical protein